MNRSFLLFVSILIIVGLLGVAGSSGTIQYYSDDILCRYKVPLSCGSRKTLLCESNHPDVNSTSAIEDCGCDIRKMIPNYGNKVFLEKGCVVDEFRMSGYEMLLLGMKIDLNSATFDDLVSIDGIGESIAGRILEYKYSVGRFERVDDLLSVKGIGKKTLTRLNKYLCVDCNRSDF